MSRFSDAWARQAYTDVTSCTRMDGPAVLQAAAMGLFRRSVVERLRRLTMAGGPIDHIVDIGCGDGAWVGAYLDLGARVTGVDVSAGFLAEAQRRLQAAVDQGRVELLHGDALAFDELYRGADLVCLGACPMYFSDEELEELLARISAGQRPGQWIYLRASVADPGGARFETDGGVYRLRQEYDRAFARHGYRTHLREDSMTMSVAGAVELALPVRAEALGPVLEPVIWEIRRKTRAKTGFCNWALERTTTG